MTVPLVLPSLNCPFMVQPSVDNPSTTVLPEERQRFADALARARRLTKDPPDGPSTSSLPKRIAQFLKDWGSVLTAAAVMIAALETLLGNVAGASTKLCAVARLPCSSGHTSGPI